MPKMRTIVGWAFVLFLAYYLITKPASAAGAVHNVLGALKSAGASLSTFVSSL